MSIRKAWRRWVAYQQTVRQLNALGNRELSDLGIMRHEIPDVARRHTALL